jgi:hypothetical protein
VSRDDEPSERGTDEEMVVARLAVLGGGISVATLSLVAATSLLLGCGIVSMSV